MPEVSIAEPMSLPRTPGRKIVRREEAQSWIDGYRFLEEAQRAADALARDARTAYEEAKACGFEEGRRAGGDQAAAIIADTSAKVDRYLASIESQVGELALSIAEQVLGQFPDVEVVTRAAKQALESFRREKYLRVRVSPLVLQEVQQALAAWSATELPGMTLVVEANPHLKSRQCTIATEFAVVDASVEEQLNILRRTLTVGGT
jgi:type III secretion protein L